MVNEHFKQWFGENYTVQRNGNIRNRSNRRVTVDNIWPEWMMLKRFREASGNWAPVEPEDIEEYAESERDRLWPSNNNDNVDLRAQQDQQALVNFVSLFEEGYEIKYTGTSFILVKKGQLFMEQVSPKTASNEIRLRMTSLAQRRPASEDGVAAIVSMLDEAKREKRSQALKLVQYDPAMKEKGFSFREWTEQLFVHYGIANTKLNRVMWKYFLHCIKRAAFGLKGPDFKIMFLIFSRVQGIGKSRLLKHLCDPFVGAFNPSATLSQLLDDNSVKALCTEGTALLDFQELGLGKSKNDNIDIAQMLKRIITLDEHKSRELYTSTNTTTLLNAVLSSSTNLHISEVVGDTDYRRYYVFESSMDKPTAIKKDWEEVDSFFNDTLADAYRFLNEEEIPTISKEMMTELREVQEGYARRVDLVTQWLNDAKITIVGEEDSEKEGVNPMDISLLYKRFKSFLQNCGLPQYSRQRMQQLIATSCDILPSMDADSKLIYYVKGGK